MGQAIAVRMDYTAGEVRGLAKRVKDAEQARRLLAIAAVLDGASRTEAAKIGGMDRPTLRDWVIRFDEFRLSSMQRTGRFSPGSWRKSRSRRSMAWCGGGPAI